MTFTSKKFYALLIFVISTICCMKCNAQSKNNVCPNLADYINLSSDKCWYNSDVGLSAEEIIRKHGYDYESYNTITEDGYKLQIFRIPGQGKPILLQHGLFCSGEAFLLLQNESLAFTLNDQGFDVWIGNFRGTLNSNGHTDPDIPQQKYWDFSFHEMGYYDLPAILNIMNSKTQQKAILLGHSMGATAAYVYAITRKSEAENKISAIVSMSSIAYYKYVTHFSKYLYPLANDVKDILNFLQIYSFGMSNDFKQNFYQTLCLKTPGVRLFCDLIMDLFLENLLPGESIPPLLTMVPAGTSLKTIYHYGQEAQNQGQFQFYDYGSGNFAKYNSTIPPAYDVGQIGVPVHIFYGERDTIGDKKDVFMFYEELTANKSITKIAVNGEVNFSHIDFLVGRDIQFLHEPLLQLVKTIN